MKQLAFRILKSTKMNIKSLIQCDATRRNSLKLFVTKGDCSEEKSTNHFYRNDASVKRPAFEIRCGHKSTKSTSHNSQPAMKLSKRLCWTAQLLLISLVTTCFVTTCESRSTRTLEQVQQKRKQFQFHCNGSRTRPATRTRGRATDCMVASQWLFQMPFRWRRWLWTV